MQKKASLWILQVTATSQRAELQLLTAMQCKELAASPTQYHLQWFPVSCILTCLPRLILVVERFTPHLHTDAHAAITTHLTTCKS